MSAMTLQGVFYDGCVPIGTDATLMLAGKRISLIGAEVSERFDAEVLRVSPRSASANRFVALPDGGQFQCADDPALDCLPQEVPSEGFVAWLERQWPVAGVALALIVAIVASAYVYGLPVAAERVAARIPFETEKALGEDAVDWMDSNLVLTHSKIDKDTQGRLLYRFDEMLKGLPASEHYRLGFRSSDYLGANAFAFPGGTIIITDALIELADSDEDVLAILAHEIGHIEKRHAVRHILQDSAVAVVASALTGDAASLGVAVVGIPTILTSLEFSREFESEADSYAFELMTRYGISPQYFADMMQRMVEEQPVDDESEWGEEWGFLSSHPPSDDRIARAHDAARRFEQSQGVGQ
jgi:Zn-dependent protease with chaperone function